MISINEFKTLASYMVQYIDKWSYFNNSFESFRLLRYGNYDQNNCTWHGDNKGQIIDAKTICAFAMCNWL